jgi:hypothetical protein
VTSEHANCSSKVSIEAKHPSEGLN